MSIRAQILIFLAKSEFLGFKVFRAPLGPMGPMGPIGPMGPMGPMGPRIFICGPTLVNLKITKNECRGQFLKKEGPSGSTNFALRAAKREESSHNF